MVVEGVGGGGASGWGRGYEEEGGKEGGRNRGRGKEGVVKGGERRRGRRGVGEERNEGGQAGLIKGRGD